MGAYLDVAVVFLSKFGQMSSTNVTIPLISETESVR